MERLGLSAELAGVMVDAAMKPTAADWDCSFTHLHELHGMVQRGLARGAAAPAPASPSGSSLSTSVGLVPRIVDLVKSKPDACTGYSAIAKELGLPRGDKWMVSHAVSECPALAWVGGKLTHSE